MSQGFVAYIDESGDEGFEATSSQWFILSACLVRERDRLPEMRRMHNVIGPIETIRQKSVVHFSSLSHDARLVISHALSTSKFVAVSICFDKVAINQDAHTLKGNRRLYFYATRLLLERLSWFARDNQPVPMQGRPCKLVFSKCKKLSYDDLRAYIQRLKNNEFQDVQIWYDFLDLDNYQVRNHEDSLGCRLADAISSGLRLALQPSKYGLCEDQHALHYRSITYSRNGNFTSYGLKFMPAIPVVQAEKNNMYAWISKYQG